MPASASSRWKGETSRAGLGGDPPPDPVPAVHAPFPQIGDRVWKDLNGNGLQDPGEAGIAGVTLQLFQGTKLVGTTVTDGQARTHSTRGM